MEFDGYVSLVAWDRFQKFLAKVRSRSGQKRSNFQIYKFGQKRYQSWPVSAQESNGVICFCVRPPEVTKIAFEKKYVIIGYAFGDKNTPFGGQKLSYWLEILYTGRRLVDE